MKKMLIIGPFPPLFSYGGPTKSVKGLYDVFSQTDIHCSVLSPNTHLDRTKLTEINLNKDIIFCKNQFTYLINNSHKFDVIWLNSLFDLKIILLCLIKVFTNFHLIVSPRGQLSSQAISTSKPLLKNFFLKILFFFKSNLIFHSTSISESENISFFFNKTRVKMISNIFSLNYKTNLVTDRKFVFYSRIHKKKGLDILLKTIKKYNLKIDLDIYGFIEDKRYWKLCTSLFKNNPKVEYKGIIEDGDISKLKDKYSFFILPTLNENFGHVIIELLSIGCIPIISKDTTPFDQQISSVFNLNFNLHSQSNLNNVLNQAINMSNDDLILLKSRVKPCFEKIDKMQEKNKREYIKFVNNLII